jgi:flagellar hook-associated protein 2
MAVSSTNNNSSLGSAAIDVAGIVEQLMTVENRPLERIKAQIEQKQLVISDLGTIRGKVATFQDALKILESPTTFNNSAASSSDSTVISATAGNGAIKGNHSIQVSALATPTRYAVTGFGSSDAPLGQSLGSFSIQVGDGEIKQINLDGTETISDLKNLINNLGIEVRASVIKTVASNNWVLIIQGTKTGTENAVQINDLDILNPLIPNPNRDFDEALNSEFSLDGVDYVRSTNTFNDVIEGITFNLNKIGSATVSVTKGTDISSEAINTLVAAYNDVMNTYKAMTANSSNSDKPGNFANSPSTLSFINQIKEGFARGISYTSDGVLKTMSLSTLGIDLQLDGTAKFNSTSFASASASGLRDILALGVTTGYVSSTSNLNTFINAQVKAGGLLSGQINSETEAVRSLTKRQDDLQIRLNSIQNNLIVQYSALNALLFQLSSTSNSLTSALDALTNSQKNN